MKKIFTGSINTLHLKSLSFSEPITKLTEESTILKKDALFYQNIFGKMINFEYDTCLPTKEEAEDYFANINTEAKEHNATFRECSIMYYNEDELKYLKSISSKEFKQLKKSFNQK